MFDSISANHVLMSYNSMLDINGTHVVLGLAMDCGGVAAPPLLFGRTGISGSLIVPKVYETLNSSNNAGVRYVLDCSKLAPALGTKLEPPKF